MTMKTGDFVACTGLYKKLVYELGHSSHVILIVGGPGCGKSSFVRQFLRERDYEVADVSDIEDAASVTTRISSLVGSGNLQNLLKDETRSKRVVWLDDNLGVGLAAVTACHRGSVQLLAACTSRQLSKHTAFRKKCTILKMNYPSKIKCSRFLCDLYPSVSEETIVNVVRAVNCSLPRARLAIENFGISDFIGDLRKMDMNIYDIASSVLKCARGYEDVFEMTHVGNYHARDIPVSARTEDHSRHSRNRNKRNG